MQKNIQESFHFVFETVIQRGHYQQYLKVNDSNNKGNLPRNKIKVSKTLFQI